MDQDQVKSMLITVYCKNGKEYSHIVDGSDVTDDFLFKALKSRTFGFASQDQYVMYKTSEVVRIDMKE